MVCWVTSPPASFGFHIGFHRVTPRFVKSLRTLAQGSPHALCRSPTLGLSHGGLRSGYTKNLRGVDKKRVDVAVRDQKSVSGRVWARMVHSMPTRETPALDADAEAAARLV